MNNVNVSDRSSLSVDGCGSDSPLDVGGGGPSCAVSGDVEIPNASAALKRSVEAFLSNESSASSKGSLVCWKE